MASDQRSTGIGRGRRLVAAASTAVLLAILLRAVPPNEFMQLLYDVRPGWLLAAAALYLVVHAARALRFALLLGPTGPGAMALLPLSFAVALLNHILPSRAGDVAFVPLASRYEGVSASAALAAIGVARLLDIMAVALIFLGATLLSLSDLPGRATALGAAVVLCAMAAAAMFVLGPAAARTLAMVRRALQRLGLAEAGPMPRVLTLGAETVTALDGLRGNVRGAALVVTMVTWLLTFTWLNLLVHAVGRSAALAPFIVGASFGTVAKALPLPTIGGHGLAEAGWTLGFTAVLGWPLQEAAAVGLAVSALTVLLSLVYGTFGLLWLARRTYRSNQAPRLAERAPLLCAALLGAAGIAGCRADGGPPPGEGADGAATEVLEYMRVHAQPEDTLVLLGDAEDRLPQRLTAEIIQRRVGGSTVANERRLRALLDATAPPSLVWLVAPAIASSEGYDGGNGIEVGDGIEGNEGDIRRAREEAEAGSEAAGVDDGRENPSATTEVAGLIHAATGFLDARAMRVSDFTAGEGDATLRVIAWHRSPEFAAGEFPPTVDPVHFGPLELLGWDIAPQPLQAGRPARVSVAWLSQEREPRAVDFEWQLLDATGKDVLDDDALHSPFGGHRPSDSWPAMEITVAPYVLRIADDAAPGTYELSLRLMDAIDGTQWPDDGAHVLGLVEVVDATGEAGR